MGVSAAGSSPLPALPENRLAPRSDSSDTSGIEGIGGARSPKTVPTRTRLLRALLAFLASSSMYSAKKQRPWGHQTGTALLVQINFISHCPRPLSISGGSGIGFH